MASDFLWYLPTHGDGRDLTTGAFHPGERGSTFRPPGLDYLKQVALAADNAGFFGALIPTGTHCEDAWAVAAAVAQQASRLRPLVAFRPGFVLPAVAAQTAASLQRLTGGRLLMNVVTGGSAAERRSYGDFLDHDARYERTDEFLTVARGVWKGKGFDFSGKHQRLMPQDRAVFAGPRCAGEGPGEHGRRGMLAFGTSSPLGETRRGLRVSPTASRTAV